MSSEAPSPSAAVLARRASREAKSMREESGSEEDCDEPVEWEDDDEVASEEDGSEEEVRVSNAQRGRVRLHWASQSSTGLWRSTTSAARAWARRVGHAGRWWCVVWSRVARLTSRQYLGARSTTWARTAQPRGRRTCSSSPTTTRRAVERQRARWHDPVLRRWLGLTPKRPALCLREKSQRARKSESQKSQRRRRTRARRRTARQST